MKRATLGDLLRELAMRADDEAARLEAITEHLSMDGVNASEKLATATATIARQRAEIRDLRARLKVVRPHVETLCINTFSLGGCACNECKAHRAADVSLKNWRKP